MNDKQICAFLAIADCGSFNRAGEKLFLSKQALIKQMNAMEKELGITLIHRSPSGVTLTAAGQQFRTDLIQIQRSMERAAQKCKALSLPAEQLHISCNSYPSPTLYETLSAFAQGHPEIHLKVSFLQMHLDIPQLLCHGVDLVETDMTPGWHRAGYDSLALAPQSYYCLMLPSHPLASRPQIHPSDLPDFSVAVSKHDVTPALQSVLSGASITAEIKEPVQAHPELSLNWCLNRGVYLTKQNYAAAAAPLICLPFSTPVLPKPNLYFRSPPSPTVASFLAVTDQFLPPHL